MALSEEQIKSIKQQLLQQISRLPSQQQQQAKAYIESMNGDQLQEFLVQNQLVNPEQLKGKEKKLAKTECVFCSISNKTIPSLVIYEDKDYICVLEIKPFAKGHSILIPKKHIKETKDIPSRAFSIANKIGKQITRKLKAESFHITTTSEVNHAIINIIPAYKNQPLSFERQQTSQQELQDNAMKIGKMEKRKKSDIKKEKKEKISKSASNSLPIRIP